MTTVTGLTAARMLAIEGASVIDGDIIGGNLILTRHDGTTINAGSVAGPQGPQGIQGPAGNDGVPLPIVINPQTVTAYTLVLSDKSKLVELNNASPITLTVPLNTSAAFVVGDAIMLMQTGAGQVTVVPAAGVTVNANPGLKLGGQWAAATLLKRSTNVWTLFGNITA